MVIGGLYSFYSAILACAGSIVFVGIKDGGQEARTWPLTVRSITNIDLGSAGDKQAFINLWNADADNQAIGTLTGTYGPFGCEIRLKCDVDINVLTGIFIVPEQTIGAATLTTANGQTINVPGLTRLAEFTVGPGAPMEEGDVDYSHSFLGGRRMLVLVGGMILPNDYTGTGAGMDPAGRYVQKLLADTNITFYNSVYGGENVQIYAY